MNTTLQIQSLTADIGRLKSSLSKSGSATVSAKGLKAEAQLLVGGYFRDARTTFVKAGVTDEDLSNCDADAHELLRLSQGRSLKTLYHKTLNSWKKALDAIEHKVHDIMANTRGSGDGGQGVAGQKVSAIEQGIIDTLRKLLPSACSSYQQGIIDLADLNRLSYRGAATDFRECLREVLDKLAPDDDVESAPDFKLEKGTSKPTQKQKVKYILKNRGTKSKFIQVSLGSVDLIEELTGTITRGIYTAGSIAVHTQSSRQEVRQLKNYLDPVLADLLELQ